jgi:uncharacterized membrane protein
MAATTEKMKQLRKNRMKKVDDAPEMPVETEAGAATAEEGRSVEKWAYVAGGAALALAGGALVVRRITGRQGGDIDHSPSATVGHNQGVRVEKTVTVNAQPDTLYHFWRNFENLPRFMDHLESVRVDDSTRSHWVVKAPAGQTVEWDAQIINDIPNELIAWKTMHADIANAGSVRFRLAPGGKGTEVTVNLEYDPPAGKVGQVVAKVFGEEPEQQVEDDLRHFKQVMETGEMPTTEGQPTGR